MKNNIMIVLSLITLLCVTHLTKTSAQRAGRFPSHAVINSIMIADGPNGPIKGGESAVTDLLLQEDGFVYGSTKAIWGAENCHLFRTDSETIEHLLNVTANIPEQTAVTDLTPGKDGNIFGCTSTSDEVFDENSSGYDGGHLFIYNTGTGEFKDLGIMSGGQGIKCIEFDKRHSIIYGITYPAGHLFSFNPADNSVKDFGEIITPWKVKDFGRVSWRGVPGTLIIDDAGTVYYSTYFRREIAIDEKELMKGGATALSSLAGGRIYSLAYGEDKPVFTNAVIPVQSGMDTDPLYENGIGAAIPAKDGGFWCGTINDGFLFKFYPSTSTVINLGKAFQFWNLKSFTYGGDNNLYMLGGNDEQTNWLLKYNSITGSNESLGWLDNLTKSDVICTDKNGRILIGENLRHSNIIVIDVEKITSTPRYRRRR